MLNMPTGQLCLCAIITSVLIAFVSVSTVVIVFRLTETSQKPKKEHVRDTTLYDDDNVRIATLARHDQEIKAIRTSFLEALNATNASKDMAMKSMHSDLKDNYKRGLIEMNETRNLILHTIKEDLSTNFTRDLIALYERLVMQITQTEANLTLIKKVLADQSSRLSLMQLSYYNEAGQIKKDIQSLRQKLSNGASVFMPKHFLYWLACVSVFINL